MPRCRSRCTSSDSSLDARVHVRVLVHDVGDRAHDERQVGEREALLGLPLGLVRPADPLDALEVDLDRRVDVRARRLRTHHVLGGPAPDVVERHDGVAGTAHGCRCRCGRRRCGRRRCGRRRCRRRARRCGGGRSAWRGPVRRRGRAASRTSLRVMRPPSPVPLIWAASRPCSAIRRRTSGEVTRPPPPPLPAGAGAGAGAAAGAAGGGRRAPERRGRSCAAAPARRRAPGRRGSRRWPSARWGRPRAACRGGRARPSPITARRAPTGTVSPSGTRISVTTPALGAGTSESTLSVDTSKSGSSACTDSPTCLNQRVMVPSVTVSPSCGMVTSTTTSFPGRSRLRLPRGRSPSRRVAAWSRPRRRPFPGAPGSASRAAGHRLAELRHGHVHDDVLSRALPAPPPALAGHRLAELRHGHVHDDVLSRALPAPPPARPVTVSPSCGMVTSTAWLLLTN